MLSQQPVSTTKRSEKAGTSGKTTKDLIAFAIYPGKEQMWEILEKYRKWEVSLKEIHKYAQAGNLRVVKAEIESGVSVNEEDIMGGNVLYWACQSGNRDLIMFLYKTKASASCITRFTRDTVLHVLSKKGHGHLIRMVVENWQLHGNIKARNVFGKSPLDITAENGDCSTLDEYMASMPGLRLSDSVIKTAVRHRHSKYLKHNLAWREI